MHWTINRKKVTNDGNRDWEREREKKVPQNRHKPNYSKEVIKVNSCALPSNNYNNKHTHTHTECPVIRINEMMKLKKKLNNWREVYWAPVLSMLISCIAYFNKLCVIIEWSKKRKVVKSLRIFIRTHKLHHQSSNFTIWKEAYFVGWFFNREKRLTWKRIFFLILFSYLHMCHIIYRIVI